jgi:hypothetical protein
MGKLSSALHPLDSCCSSQHNESIELIPIVVTEVFTTTTDETPAPRAPNKTNLTLINICSVLWVTTVNEMRHGIGVTRVNYFVEIC